MTTVETLYWSETNEIGFRILWVDGEKTNGACVKFSYNCPVDTMIAKLRTMADELEKQLEGMSMDT
jgi:hypothetical protein